MSMPEIKETYTEVEKFKVSIYVDIDVDYNIVSSYIGRNVIPDRQYHYFFYDEAYVGDNIQNYKVILVDNFAQLDAIDKELEQRIKDNYFATDRELLQQEYQKKLEELALLESQLNSI
jgi:hypothetical protein